MMTRKHFTAIAALIKQTAPTRDELVQIACEESREVSEYHKGQRWQAFTIAQGLCPIFQAENLQFDRAKFLAACGFED